MRLLKRVAAAAGILLVLVAAGLGGLLYSTLPGRQQTLHLAGLSAPVAISFDSRGIPRIRARTEHDAAMALGVLHARDRMAQMELNRRIGSGRISELVGSAGLPIDRMMRVLGLRRAAERDYAALPTGLRDVLAAYAQGVNAEILARGRFIAPEFLLLGRPAPWTPVDSLLWGKLMGLTLGGNWTTELARAGLLGRMSVQAALKLWPDEGAVPAPWAGSWHTRLTGDAMGLLAAALPRFPDRFTEPNEESDEWAVDGRHSATGAPLLAGDPHLGLEAPGLWYLARIAVPGFTWTGATAPGVPLLVLGQNGRIAWTITSNSADTQDVFIETLRPDGRYDTPDGPRAFIAHRERIHVRGAPDVVLDVRESRHGPVISDIIAGAARPGTALAVSMQNLAPGDPMAGLWALDHAASVAEAGRDAGLVAAPVQNLLVADRAGIGQFTTGAVPLRKTGDGSLPVEGADGAHDWIGTARGAALPHVVSPASGRLLNGNERTAPADFPVFLGRDWPWDWRARRIRTLLDDTAPQTPEHFAAMQGDIVSAFAQAMLPHLAAVALDLPATAAAARGLLRGWDGSMSLDAPQPLIFNAWMQAFAASLLARHEAPPRATAPWEDIVADALSAHSGFWCGGDCTPMLRDSLIDASTTLARAFGNDPALWRWRAAHRAVFTNQALGAIPLLGRLTTRRVAVAGDDTTLLRAGGGRLGAFDAVHGAAYRGVYDLADPDRSRFVAAPGQSGNWLSGDAWNLLRDWQSGATFTLGPQPDRVSATMSLRP